MSIAGSAADHNYHRGAAGPAALGGGDTELRALSPGGLWVLGSPDVPPGPVCFGYCSYDPKLEQVGPVQLTSDFLRLVS